ncbi:MAG: hypothetical protein K1X94_33920 [Sandaracinaceae bacterium]|nr:hypothetical protein [Sandaracinaceae bacterium]
MLRPTELAALAVLLFAPIEARGAVIARADDKTAASPERDTYLRPFATVGSGVGLRFNNPYRLATPLGDDAESLSLTAPYASLGAGVALGDPLGWQHGPVVRWDFALTGVPQHVLVPSYGVFRRGAVFGGQARFGLPILLSPDANMGVEGSVGATWYARAGLGFTAEVLGDLFWGAATPENKRPVYPVLSLQLGAVVELERLP